MKMNIFILIFFVIVIEIVSAQSNETNKVLKIIGIDYYIRANNVLERLPANSNYLNINIYSIPEDAGDFINLPFELCDIIVGTSKEQYNAEYIFNRLKNVGLNPTYEIFNDHIRIVLRSVMSESFKQIISNLGVLGFGEIFLRIQY